MKRLRVLIVIALALGACSTEPSSNKSASAGYLDYSGRDDALSGGVKLIPISTSKGTFRVWTKRVGNNPKIKVLLLHGGPGATHEYFEAFDSYFPAAEIEYYYYDQLGSAFSDQPSEPDLWELPRFVEEVEQVRPAVYVPMQGPSELGASGKLVNWDRSADLGNITVPTLVIGAQHDTMDPKHMEWMAGQVRKGRYLHCPDGSHLALYDDQKIYFGGLIQFIRDVNTGRF